MGDDDQLEIRVGLTLIDDTAQYQGQSLSSEIVDMDSLY